jgi:hypothetical protein
MVCGERQRSSASSELFNVRTRNPFCTLLHVRIERRGHDCDLVTLATVREAVTLRASYRSLLAGLCCRGS